MRASILVPAFLFCSHLSAENQIAERGRGGERHDFRNSPNERNFEHRNENWHRGDNWRDQGNVNINPILAPEQETPIIIPDEENQIYNQNQQ